MKTWEVTPYEYGLRVSIEATQHPADTTIMRIVEDAFPGTIAELGDIGKVFGDTYFGGRGEVLLKHSSINADDVEELFQTISEVITICDDCNVSHCLDFYRTPVESATSPEEWPYTETGRLVFHAKYWKDASAAETLGVKIAEFSMSHLSLARADLVCAVPPSTEHSGPDLPASWASTVAGELSTDVVDLRRVRAVSKQKEISDLGERKANQRGSMQCDEDLRGRSALILDDICTQGDTMDEAARALRAAGASQVYGLCAVKTVKGTRGLDTLLEQ